MYTLHHAEVDIVSTTSIHPVLGCRFVLPSGHLHAREVDTVSHRQVLAGSPAWQDAGTANPVGY
jgi:hypothetical protein